jgi:hypothetical protein
MDVELLVIADCPHAGPASELLRVALDDIGLTAQRFTTTVIDGLEQAQDRGFPGSPTIVANGVDLFPDPERAVALACRVYVHSDGTTGLPDLAGLRQCLKRAADQPGARRH